MNKKLTFLYLVGGMSSFNIDKQGAHDEDENDRSARLVTVDQNTLDILIERYNVLENQMQTLHCKTDKILKIALNSNNNDQVYVLL
jgi:hypothetical protein